VDPEISAGRIFRGGGENEITRREMSNGEKVRREEDLPAREVHEEPPQN